MTILIISHTEHYLNDAGEVVGWGPTIKELDFLAEQYGKVIHIACMYDQKAPKSALSYQSSKVNFIPIPPYGGAGIKNKLKILTTAPSIIRTVLKQIKNTDIFQFRAPTSMGLFLIPVLTLFSRKKGWYKYAGNWMQPNKPLSYRLQKYMLEHQKRPVTINGKWPRQKPHIHTFENPSLNNEHIETGLQIIEDKCYDGKLTACFVGRLEDAKGVGRIIDSLDLLYKNGITKMHFVGNGAKLEEYKQQASNSKIECLFHGFLDKNQVFEIYKKSHLNLLPSDSEGFPKTISEGACFGSVPVVSAVSSIPQYVNENNGYLWDIDKETFSEFIARQHFSKDNLKSKAQSAKEFAKLFTFETLQQKLEKYIFHNTST